VRRLGQIARDRLSKSRRESLDFFEHRSRRLVILRKFAHSFARINDRSNGCVDASVTEIPNERVTANARINLISRAATRRAHYDRPCP